MSSKISTKDRILDAAEGLFADRGFAETSLRVITTRADVNLASVNYHFGSKKSLIQAVFDRFLEHFSAALMSELKKLESLGGEPSVEQVLATLIRPLNAIDEWRPNGTAVFMRLLGRAYAETQGHLRRYLMDKYGATLFRFTTQLHRAKPDLPAYEVFWRLHFMLGTVIFTLAGGEALAEIAKSDFNQPTDVEGIARRLIPFLAAGMRAETFSYGTA